MKKKQFRSTNQISKTECGMPKHMIYVGTAWTMVWRGHIAQESENHNVNTKLLNKSLEDHKLFQCKVSHTGKMGRYGKHHETLKHQSID